MARFGRGKYWNLGLQDASLLSATDRQIRYLNAIYRKDFHGEGLTRGQASDLIEAGMSQRTKDQAALSDLADQMFSLYMKRAIEAANAAGDKWLEQNPDALFVVATPEGLQGVHGEIGFAWFTAPKKGSGLAKWLEQHGFNDRRSPKTMALEHKHAHRLEGELQLACCIAAYNVLKEAQTEIGGIRIIYKTDNPNFSIAA